MPPDCRRPASLAPLLPINEPAPAYLQTPTLYGETTGSQSSAALASPRSPNYSFRDLRSPPNVNGPPRSSPNCPYSHQQSVAALLINGGEQRHRRAWVHKRGNASTTMLLSPRYEEHAESSESPTLAQRRNSVINKIRLARFFVFGLALVGVLATYLTLALRPDRAPLPTLAHALLILLLIALAILTLHALIRYTLHSRAHRKLSLLASQQRRRRRHHAGQSHRHSYTRHGNKFIRRCRDGRPAERQQPTLLNTEHDPDALPDGDECFSPATPVRVHLAHEELGYSPDKDVKHDAYSPVSPLTPPPSAVLAPSTVTPSVASCRVPPLTIHPNGPINDRVQAHGAMSPAMQSTTASSTTSPTPTPPPPAYGLWRCSVRADPELLHWRRVPVSGSATPLVSPTGAAAPAPAPTVSAAGATQPPAYSTLSSLRYNDGNTAHGGVTDGERESWLFNTRDAGDVVVLGEGERVVGDYDDIENGRDGRRLSVQDLTRALLREH